MMFNRIHQKLGTAGFVISLVALIAALGGGAYAASGGLTGKQKKEVEKIAKKYAGKQGPTGATGLAGSPGSKGDAGAAGVNGNPGAPGSPGAEGSPWVAGGTLPPGQTETGTWAVNQPATATTTHVRIPISFPIPLPEAVKAVHLNATETETETEKEGCLWEYLDPTALPTAPPGTLCVWSEPGGEVAHATGFSEFVSHEANFFEEAAPTGALMWMALGGSPGSLTEEPTYAKLVETGVWAVTTK